MLVSKKLPLLTIDNQIYTMSVIVLGTSEVLHITIPQGCQKLKMRSMMKTDITVIKRMEDVV
jgi:hypothetical protein